MLWGIIIAGVLLLSLILGSLGWIGGGPIFAIPIFIVVAAGALVLIVGGRSVLRTRRHHQRIRHFRAQARAQKQDFTPADRRTLV